MKNEAQGVYAILNKINGKLYVGSSENMPRRKTCHFRELRNGVHRNCHLQSAFNSYFEFAILESVENAFWLRARECAWIKRLRATDREVGYNITEDAWSPLSDLYQSEERKIRRIAVFRSESYRKKRSLIAIRWQREHPQKRTQEWKNAQSKRSQKLWSNDGHRKNMSALHSSWHANPENKKLHAEAQRQLYKDPLERSKQSKSQRKRYQNPEARRITSEATRAGIARKHIVGDIANG